MKITLLAKVNLLTHKYIPNMVRLVEAVSPPTEHTNTPSALLPMYWILIDVSSVITVPNSVELKFPGPSYVQLVGSLPAADIHGRVMVSPSEVVNEVGGRKRKASSFSDKGKIKQFVTIATITGGEGNVDYTNKLVGR